MTGMKMWSISAGWFDYDNDGKLDLFVSELLQVASGQGSVLRAESEHARLLPSEELPAAAEHAVSQQWGRHVH